MSHGQLRCAGSPLFLKNAYGVGYQLTIDKPLPSEKREYNELMLEEQKTSEEVDKEGPLSNGELSCVLRDIVFSGIPETRCLMNSSTSDIYQLPMKAAPKFAPIFEKLDDLADAAIITGYGVGMTTIVSVETVFHYRSC
jgi:ATP-binding cassette subfamily A (ABC1) protein 2